MSLILQQIRKAERRCGAWNPLAAAEAMRDKTPRELNSPEQKSARWNFLRQSLGPRGEPERFFERIINGNELQDANYLARGARAARAVGRVAIHEQNGRRLGWGTGFLIAPQVLITNHHVLPTAEAAVRSEVHFEYERDIDGALLPHVPFRLLPEQLFHSNEELDFAVVAVAPRAETAERELAEFGFLPLLATLGKVSDGEWLTIVQHPNGEQKQVCVRENRLLRRDETVLWYSADTLGGSSGAPVFNNDWFVVALHHSGVPERRNGVVQTVDGRDWDPAIDGEDRIKWIANEGIRASRLTQALQERLPAHPLLQPLFNATPASARVRADEAPGTAAPSLRSVNASAQSALLPTGSPAKVITVQLEVNDAGGVRVLSSDVMPRPQPASLRVEEADFDVPFDTNYATRKGFAVDFLGSKAVRVNLPNLSPALKAVASRLLAPKAGNEHVLHYHNFSLVMHAKRRLAIYTAANVRGDQRYAMKRPADVWREDPRIPLEEQLTAFYYKDNQFDRGHLTRREDLEYGPTALAALQSAADTCHWTNCTPQHARFNQGKELWQGIERHVLEHAIQTNQFNAQVFTGPVFEEDDPSYSRFPKIQYPVRFWKVVAAVNAHGKLFATAYLLDQSETIARYGLEAAPEVPFGAYKTFQVKIAEVERLTQLLFTYGSTRKSLRDCDPLAVKPPPKRRSTAPRVEESTAGGAAGPNGYRPLGTFADIYTG